MNLILFVGHQKIKMKENTMADLTDTFERSCDHWSEAGRREMEGFYALASVDYSHLAKAIDWKSWLEKQQNAVKPRDVKLLDVACGSGKFPSALIAHAGVTNAEIRPIDYALLDPSYFSISEARNSLDLPFKAGAEYEVPLQDLECSAGYFDIVWATHALYAIPNRELKSGLERFVHAMGFGSNTDGIGFIAHASSRSHYLRFFEYYLEGFKGSKGTPYSSSEEIITVLTEMGVPIQIKEISYVNQASKAQESQVEKYLQRCLFDDTISLKEMLSNPITGPYLEGCYTDNMWQFKQHVSMIFLNTTADDLVGE